MVYNLKLVKIDQKYCNYLRKFDNRVTYNFDKKENRPFVGILFQINNCEYFAPLSSPKPKHLKMKNNIDFIKIENGLYGVVNFNNMIPVQNNNYTIILLNKKFTDLDSKQYQELLKNQLTWLNENYIQVKNKSSKLYNLYSKGKLNDRIMKRCCDFKLLEKKCTEYNK